MKRMLDDYRFDDSLRYERHVLWYMSEDGIEIQIGGILGAAVLGALLVDTDEGDARGIAVDGSERRREFFDRYEREVRRDNGGLFVTEVQALSQAYMELAGAEGLLSQICRNDRLFDLAIGLMVEYMQRLVREAVCEQIYDMQPWYEPFAKWLYDAAFVETSRQHLLSINWTRPEEVYALAQTYPEKLSISEPTFIFDGLSSEKILTTYFNWLWSSAKKEASVLPDAKVQLAEYRQQILETETDWEFIKPEVAKLSYEDRKLFEKWMTQWVDFVTQQLRSTFPPTEKRIYIEQKLFPDDVLDCPPPNNYAATRDYIYERCRYDKVFKEYFESHQRKDFCQQLSVMFGWDVDANALGKRLNYKKK